jgi:rfaE bifunctional protein kinase chain/domain
MNPERFEAITSRYATLRITVAGDFCLDRYLEIDPARSETSIETGLPVHKVTRVRAQPGGAGTILNNLAALGVGVLWPVGICGDDGEGYELQRALARTPGVRMDCFLATPERRTFTYCKPLVLRSGEPPEELNRLDSKNWTTTPPGIVDQAIGLMRKAFSHSEAVILLGQVDLPDTGLLTSSFLQAVQRMTIDYPASIVLADNRQGLAEFPPLIFKMNAAELARSSQRPFSIEATSVAEAASLIAKRNGRSVVVTLAERGMVGAEPNGHTEYVPSLPIRGPIDVVGAGDSVSANLAAALASGASLREALELATAAASVVIHQLGTTGTATIPQLRQVLGFL